MKLMLGHMSLSKYSRTVIIDIRSVEIIPLAYNKTLIVVKVNGFYRSMSVWLSGENIYDKMTKLVMDYNRPQWTNRFMAIAHANGDILADGAMWAHDAVEVPF